MPYFLIGRRSVIGGGVFLWEKAKMGVARENGERAVEVHLERVNVLVPGSTEWVWNKPRFSFALALLIYAHRFV